MKLVVISLSLGVVALSLVGCSSTDSSSGSGGGGGYGTGGGGTSAGGTGGGGATGGGGGVGGGVGGSTSGGGSGGTSGGGGSSGAGGSTSCPLQIQGTTQQCADCITGKCCNEFVACGQDTACNGFNSCVVTNKPDCSAATDAATLKACLTKACPVADAAYDKWVTGQMCAQQSCAAECPAS